jgi:hypothetical protein
MEIERSLDYENKTLILYEKKDDKIPESVSSMIRTLPPDKVEFKGYTNPDEIPSIIDRFLPRFDESGT